MPNAVGGFGRRRADTGSSQHREPFIMSLLAFLNILSLNHSSCNLMRHELHCTAAIHEL